jgi:hypothetical protein
MTEPYLQIDISFLTSEKAKAAGPGSIARLDHRNGARGANVEFAACAHSVVAAATPEYAGYRPKVARFAETLARVSHSL